MDTNLSIKTVTENGAIVICPPIRRENNLKETLKAEIMEELKAELAKQNPAADTQQG